MTEQIFTFYFVNTDKHPESKQKQLLIRLMFIAKIELSSHKADHLRHQQYFQEIFLTRYFIIEWLCFESHEITIYNSSLRYWILTDYRRETAMLYCYLVRFGAGGPISYTTITFPYSFYLLSFPFLLKSSSTVAGVHGRQWSITIKNSLMLIYHFHHKIKFYLSVSI